MEAFEEFYLCVTLLDAGRSHGKVLITRKVILGEAAEERANDKRPIYKKAVGIMGVGLNNVIVRHLWVIHEEEPKFLYCKQMTLISSKNPTEIIIRMKKI